MSDLGDDPTGNESATSTNNFLFVPVVKTEIKEEICPEDTKQADEGQSDDIAVSVQNVMTKQNAGTMQKPTQWKYCCRICGEQFTQKRKQKQHEVLHMIRKLHRCKLCNVSYLRNYLLMRHSKTHSTSNLPCTSDCSPMKEHGDKVYTAKGSTRAVSTYQCPLCFEAVSGILKLNRHAAEHSVDMPFKCGLCINRFKEESELLQHSIQVHNAEESYSCKFCNRKFKSHLMLGGHILEHGDKSFMGDLQKRFVCHFCNKRFQTASNLVWHLVVHIKERWFQCQICNKAFHRKKTLIDHLRIHSNEKPFKCDICGIQFRIKATLRRHVVTHKVRRRNYACHVCGKGFMERDTLKKHEKIHAKEHKCTFCGKLYASKRELDEHNLTHSKPRPYKCQYCVFAYSHRRSLQRHVQQHFNIQNERPKRFECEYCEKVFPLSELLGDHVEKEHGGFGCTMCEQSFRSREALDAHVDQHIAERNKCQLCGMSFMSEFGLTLHMRIHTGERQLKCSSCKVYRKPINMKQRPCLKCAKLNEGISSTPVLPVTAENVEVKPNVKLEWDP